MSRQRAFGRRSIPRRLVLERLEDRVAPSDLLALLAVGAMAGALDEESQAADFAGGVEFSETELVSNAAAGTRYALDLSRWPDERDVADEPPREGASERNAPSPSERDGLEETSHRDALSSDLRAELGDEFFIPPELLREYAARFIAPPAAEAAADVAASDDFAPAAESAAPPPDGAKAASPDAETLADGSWLSGLEGFSEGAMMSMMGQSTITVVAMNGDVVVEGSSDPQKFKFTRTGGMQGMQLTVAYAMSGTATALDYSSPLTINGNAIFAPNQSTTYVALNVNRDNKVEPAEPAILTITPGAMYVVGSPSSATVTILDDPPRVSVSAPDPLAAEENQATGKFRFSRTGGKLAEALEVRYRVDGSTASFLDYGPPPSPAGGGEYQITIGANQPHVDFTLTPADDATVEGDEFVRFTVVAHPGPNTYLIGATTAMVLIEDNDAEVLVDLDIHDGQFDAVVPDPVEFTYGAYTVANLNDTDGDGRIDSLDPDVRSYSAASLGGGNPGIAPNWVVVIDPSGLQEGDQVFVSDGDSGTLGSDRRTIDQIGEDKITFTTNLSRPYGAGTVSHGGRDEVDLMKLVVRRPNPDVGGFVTLTAGGAVALWQESWKETLFTTMMIAVDSIPVGGLELWVEATETSSALRDIVIQLEYQGVKDVVSATGIWSTVTAVAHDLRTVADLYNDPEWSDIDGEVRLSLDVLEVVGLRPITLLPNAVFNVIAIQFTIYPYRDPAIHGTWEDEDIEFDVTRQVDVSTWNRPDEGDPFELFSAKEFPIEVELPNDDLDDHDESNVVTARGRFYSEDAPGLSVLDTFGEHEVVRHFDAYEWLRVRFDGARPSGDTVSGSRTSDVYAWHAAHWLIDDGTGKWKRTTGDGAEVEFVNDVGPGHGEWTEPE